MKQHLFGTVMHRDGRFNVVECADAPSTHLKTLHLTDAQIGGARLGDDVELAYRVTSTSGLWVVVKVIGARNSLLDKHLQHGTKQT